jgi:hypothetical protein
MYAFTGYGHRVIVARGEGDRCTAALGLRQTNTVVDSNAPSGEIG